MDQVSIFIYGLIFRPLETQLRMIRDSILGTKQKMLPFKKKHI